MKGIIIGSYLVISVLSGIFMNAFGDYSYKGFAYNVGRGLVWPAILFESDPEIDGSTIETFSHSLGQLINSHKEQSGKIMAISSMGNVLMLEAIKKNKNISASEIKRLLHGSPQSMDSMLNEIYSVDGEFTMDNALSVLQDKLDGADFSDIIDEGDNALDDIKDIIDERS